MKFRFETAKERREYLADNVIQFPGNYEGQPDVKQLQTEFFNACSQNAAELKKIFEDPRYGGLEEQDMQALYTRALRLVWSMNVTQ
jgi:hypothetical protein